MVAYILSSARCKCMAQRGNESGLSKMSKQQLDRREGPGTSGEEMRFTENVGPIAELRQTRITHRDYTQGKTHSKVHLSDEHFLLNES